MSSTKFVPISLQAYRGDTEVYTFTITDSDGLALDVSSYTLQAQARRFKQDAATVFDITISNTAPSNFSSGVVVLTIPAATTATLEGDYFFDIEATKTGSTITLASGILSVFADVTH